MPGQLAQLNDVRAMQYATRSAEAWDRRVQGWPVGRIARHLNVSTGTVYEYMREGLAEIKPSPESVETWRHLELSRLERMIEAWLPIAETTTHPNACRAAAIVLKTRETQARLVGLPAEPPVEVAKETEDKGAQLLKSPAARAALRRQLDAAERVEAAAGMAGTGGGKESGDLSHREHGGEGLKC